MKKYYQAQAFSCNIISKVLREGNNVKNEQGFVSIFTVIIIMAILTLLTISFTNITRQAQQNTLDNQLSTQAFYAAESGVNDALRALEIQPNLNKNDCRTGGPAGAFSYDIDTTLGISYSCVLIIPTVSEQIYDAVPPLGAGEPVVTTVQSSTGAAFNTIDIAWDSTVGTDPFPASAIAGSSPILPSRAAWGNNVGILKVDLVPTSAGLSRDALVNNSYSFMIYPVDGGAGSGTVYNTLDGKGNTVVGNCTNVGTYRCNARITTSGSASAYVMRLQSYYNPVKTSFDISSGGAPLLQINGQALIDVTGKANDVLRRVQVRVPVSGRDSFNKGSHIPFSIVSGDSLCKRVATAPPGGPFAGVATVLTGLGETSCQITE